MILLRTFLPLIYSSLTPRLPLAKIHELIFSKLKFSLFKKFLSKKGGGLIVYVSTLLCIVLGVKNVVWSRGKPWGVYGRPFLLRFSNWQQPKLYRLYALHIQFKIVQRVINIMKEERKR